MLYALWKKIESVCHIGLDLRVARSGLVLGTQCADFPTPPVQDTGRVLRRARRGGDMKGNSPSVVRCIEEAAQCGQRAAIAATEADMLRELEMAVAWLEMAKSRARSRNPSPASGGPDDQREH